MNRDALSEPQSPVSVMLIGEKCSPGPGHEFESPALRSGVRVRILVQA